MAAECTPDIIMALGKCFVLFGILSFQIRFKGVVAVFKKAMVVISLMVVLLSLSSCEARAAEVALTSVGQSPDAMMVNVMLKKAKIAADYNSAMKESDLAGQKVLIAVVGGSSKGLGAAGIDKNEELKRGVDLIAAAKAKGMKVMVMHVGGEGRRGELSDLFIKGIVPLGEGLIVVKGANADGIFTQLKPASVTMVETDSVQTAGPDLQAALKEWGVAR